MRDKLRNFASYGGRIVASALVAAFLISNIAVATDPVIGSHGRLVYNDGGNTIVIDSADFDKAVTIANNYSSTTVLANAKAYADEKDAAINTNVTNATNRITTVENAINGTATSTGLSAKVTALEGTVGDSTVGLIKTINDLNAQIATLESQIATLESLAGSISLPEGSIITMGNYKWMVCEQLDDDVVCLVACGTKNNGTINSHGAWPGYVANGNQISTENWCYKDIHSLYGETSELARFYNAFYTAEAPGGIDVSTGIYSSTAARNGLYLVSNTKAAAGTTYNTALKTAAAAYASFGATPYYSWLGTPGGTGSAYFVDSNGTVGNGNIRDNGFVLAPAFNLDLSKIKVNGFIVSLK